MTWTLGDMILGGLFYVLFGILIAFIIAGGLGGL